LARPLFLGERLGQQSTDYEALSQVVESLDGNDRYLGRRTVDTAALAGAHQVAEPVGRGMEPAHEGGDCPGLGAPRPAPLGLAVLGIDELL
jgi:hypothetical protein